MLDFLMISTRSKTKGAIEIYPKFIIKKSSDLMIRGGDFYAIWIEELGLWSTDEQDALQLIDRELQNYYNENKGKFDAHVKVLYMWDAESGMIDAWHKYCQKQMRDSYNMLDETLIYSNTETTKQDYASKRLSYPLERGDISSWDKLIGTLYTPEERHKIEWAIGSIVHGDSKRIQKFMVLYGSAGTGKSTILNIIQKLFDGYYSVFDAKALGSSSNSFALESFKTNPLVAIQHDGDLSKIEDNTRLNSLVSHELMTVNEKFKAAYSNRFKAFLFMGTNKPVKITDGKSGLIRRLIDVSPSGNKLKPPEYKSAIKQIDFELGAIAQHCKDVYMSNPGAYDDYIPVSMMGASNDFYNFVLDSYFVFKKEDGTTLKQAWEMYKTYCEESRVAYPFAKRAFKEELKNYFREYKERFRGDDDVRVRSYYSGFRTEKFEDEEREEIDRTIKNFDNPEIKLIDFGTYESIFDKECADCPAQYATKKETPSKKWEEVTNTLAGIDTDRLHYVKVPENHIVIDFDIPDENGNKCFELNLQEASKWPPTYAELSKSGNGIHLHYIYTGGDVNQLSRIYSDHVEIKVYTGKSSLRRKLSRCNNLPIANISSGLPLKGDNKKMINFDSVKSEKGLRSLIKKNLNKEIHPATKPSIDFIHKLLEDAYYSDLRYDVSDMRNAVLAFATTSTNQAEYCIKLVNKMQFKSEDPSDAYSDEDRDIVFYDVEVFPNLFLVNWKKRGEGNPVIRMINPTPTEIEDLMGFNLVGFNCRRYDNHILYARMMGYTNMQLYKLSQKIVSGNGGFFSEAYNVSYTDVYDFASAGNKKSLKKFEIELGIHHQELGLPWDEPVPEEKWTQVAEYCDNDVIATEAVFEHLAADWSARQILADIAGMTVNDTTNSLSTRIIFGKNRKPQDEFNYRNLGEPVKEYSKKSLEFLKNEGIEIEGFDTKSLLPYFPGYKFEYGKSTYRGEDVGEGGYVYAEQGIHSNVALLDVSSMHPTSVIMEVLFGPTYTAKFKEIKDARVYIKHKEWDKVRQVFDGKLSKYVDKILAGEISAKSLSNALKTVINSVYGLTSAGFENPFRDSRNIDNIVAKRGALFMLDLKYAVQQKGYTVAHIKTDSIKIPDADPEIIDFVMDFGKKYGYEFEHEATYEKMCLVNDAVYIARYATSEVTDRLYGYVPGDNAEHGGEWTATGTQFQVPYVFKKLFSKEEITFEDMCETKSVTSSLYLDFNESLEDSTLLEKVKEVRSNPDKRWTNAERKIAQEYEHLSDEELQSRIDECHNYRFVGRVGSFCPIKDGCGGGVLLREAKDKDGNLKYTAATGSKGFRWNEAEIVKTLGKEADIDQGYYINMVNDAIDTINKYGDFYEFAR